MRAEIVLMTSNEAIGEAVIRAGCDAYYDYPITPQNELTACFRCPFSAPVTAWRHIPCGHRQLRRRP